MRKLFDSSFKIALCAAIVVIWIVCAIGNFITSYTKSENITARENLKYCAEHNADKVYSEITRYTNSLYLLSDLFNLNDDYNLNEAIESFEIVADNKYEYQYLSIVTSDGESQSIDGNSCELTDADILNKIKNGEVFTFLSGSSADNSKFINISIPIKSPDGKGTASFRMKVPSTDISNLFDDTILSKGSYCLLVDASGNKIATTSSPNKLFDDSNFFSSSNDIKYYHGITGKQIKRAFDNNDSGYLEYSFNNQDRYAYYTPVGIDGWMMFTAIPTDIIKAETSSNLTSALLLSIQIAAIFIIMAIYIIVSQKNVSKKILLDQKYIAALAEYSGKTIYEWELTTDKLRRLTSSAGVFDENIKESYFMQTNVFFSRIHPDDLKETNRIYDIAKSGGSFNDARIRIQNRRLNIYVWYSISGIAVTDSDGNAYKLIAFIENINDQVLREAALSHKAEVDSLTGLFNKAATETMVSDIIDNSNQSSQSHVLMIIDIDNFKHINDKLGHKFGDDVLIEVSKGLKQLFRLDDIIGRAGGDEFFVFIKNCNSEQLIKNKAEEICSTFRKTYTANDVSVSISASIGIAVFPNDGTDFNSLYKNADTALYISKERGKDRITFYDSTTEAIYKPNEVSSVTENNE